MKKKIPTKRKYRGKWYNFYKSFRRAENANEIVEKYRTLGHLAHTIKIEDDYCVYLRKERNKK